MQDLLLTKGKKKGKRRQSTSFTPGASPSEPSLTRHDRPEESPISPTPGRRATSTPATEPRSSNVVRKVLVSTPTHPSPLHQEIPRQERSLVKRKPKNYNIDFNGEEVEKFIKKIERIAQIEGVTEEDLAMQMAFWTTDSKISDAIEAMPGYEEGNWPQLKKDLITKWGRVEPERRYRKDSLLKLLNDTQDNGGISTLSQYKMFIGEYEKIITYLLRYKYIPQDNIYHEAIFDCLSSDVKGAISKEMIKENVIVRAEDGGYIIPPMRVLKKYIEQELEARILVTKRLYSPHRKERGDYVVKERKVKFKDESFPGMQEALKNMKEFTKSLKEQKEPFKKEISKEMDDIKHFIDQLSEFTSLATPQKRNPIHFQTSNQELNPKANQIPASSSHFPYIPAQQGPRPQYKCTYCLKDGHTVSRCNDLTEDIEKRIVCKTEVLTKKFLEEKDKKVPKAEEQKKEEKSTAVVSMEDWGEWQPPCISTGIEPLNINFGLRQTKQRMEREERNKSQSLNIPEKLPVQSKEVIKKKVSFPGGYIEEEDTEEGERVIIPSKYKEPKDPNIIKEQESKPVQHPILEGIKEKSPVKKQESEKLLSKLAHKDSTPRKSVIKEEDEDSIIEKVMKKGLDQKIHLTLEEILTISPSFTDQLKFLSEKEKTDFFNYN
ncbi:hypothetical protein O181_103141 [Austropuccinia psidii MF-1]|uniref:Uncharacterized protein n=1 Tax=Austropuccinia psidii MF-1 TaxID=1389203 RepID=A0A9Q3JK28_9BASI|nr:hypothetical protein [Austropuccinia psidii MF-1]